MAVAVNKITAEEFLQLGLQNAELIDGEIEEHMPTGGLHGEVAATVSRLLGNWALAHKTGKVGVESGFIIALDPDRVRGPDVWFIRQHRLEGSRSPKGFWTIAPDLAVEVLSDSDTVRIIHGKMRDYFALGTPLIWLVYPEEQIVEVCTPDGKRQTMQKADHLDHAEVLPGFSCAVGELFS